jgi:hypothetical protein
MPLAFTDSALARLAIAATAVPSHQRGNGCDASPIVSTRQQHAAAPADRQRILAEARDTVAWVSVIGVESVGDGGGPPRVNLCR